MRASRTLWQKASWVVLAAVVVAALVIGSRPTPGPATLDQRVRAVASDIRCPTCRGQSAAVSDAPASQAIRDEIARRLQAGQSPGQIRGFLVSRYGPSILLRPPATGIAGLVWAIPVAAILLAVAGLAIAFRRWRIRPTRPVSDADRAIVAAALASQAQARLAPAGPDQVAPTPADEEPPPHLSAHEEGGVELLVDPQRSDAHREQGAALPAEPHTEVEPAPGQPAGHSAEPDPGGAEDQQRAGRVVGDGSAELAERDQPHAPGQAAGWVHDPEAVQRAVQVQRWETEDREQPSRS